MINFTIIVRGIDSTRAGLRNKTDLVRLFFTRRIRGEAEQIMRQSKPLVPVLTGTLRGSGHVPPAIEEGTRVVQPMVYGGPAAQYASFVHERLDLHHPVGQAKFLQQPAEEAAGGLAARISDGIASDIARET